MSHFAKVESGVVTQIIVAEQDFIDTLPDSANWVQTSYNTRGGVHYGEDGQPDGGEALRYNYAGIGFGYDAVADVFYAPQPYASWVLNQSTYLWEPPVAYPTDSRTYTWDDPTLSWVDAV